MSGPFNVLLQSIGTCNPSPRSVIGADRDFDDDAAANWLKYAAFMRPSTANNQLQLYPLCSHRLLYCDSTAFEGSIDMNISPATTVCFLAVSKYAIGIIHVF